MYVESLDDSVLPGLFAVELCSKLSEKTCWVDLLVDADNMPRALLADLCATGFVSEAMFDSPPYRKEVRMVRDLCLTKKGSGLFGG